MSARTVTCPNPDCKASLKLGPPPAGGKVRCPRCDKIFAVPVEAAAAEPAVLGLVPEAESRCPSCQAVLAPAAVLCVACGFNLRTGKKLEGPKKSAKKRSARGEGGPLTRDDLPELLEESRTLIDLASKELRRLPYVLGLGDDPDVAGLSSVANRPNRCDNPNCQTGLNFGGKTWYVRVSFSAGRQKMVVNLCQDCAEVCQADLASRDSTALSYLDEARTDLERAARRFPGHRDIEAALRDVRKIELLAGLEKPRRRACFIATAAFGTPFAAEVQTLRRFRDEVLQRSALGRCFSNVYYTLSPPLAALIARSAAARALVRWLLGPVVHWCRRLSGS
jgi:hypothetical protein